MRSLWGKILDRTSRTNPEPRGVNADVLLLVGVSALVCLAGFAAAGRPWLASLVFLPFLAIAFVRKPWIRIGTLIAVALQAFGSSANFNAQKLVFIALVPVTLALAVHGWKARSDTGAVRARWLGFMQAVWGVYLLASIGRSMSAGAGAALVFRDSIPYLTWSLALLWAHDLSGSTVAAVKRVSLVLSTLAALGMGLTWIALRGGAALPTALRLFPSVSLAVMGVYLAGAILLCRGLRPLPLVCLIASCTGLALTGTRTLLIVPVAMLVMLYGCRRLGLIGIFRTGMVVAIIAGSLAVFPAVAGRIGVSSEFLARRGLAISLVLDDGISSDASGEQRQRSYSQALRVFSIDPLFGQGPGYQFDQADGEKALGLDTPLTFPAKFGLIGVALLLGLIGGVIALVRSLARSADLEWRLAAAGFATFQVLYLPFGGAFDDKGLGLALVLLIGGLWSSAQQPLSHAEDLPDRALDDQMAPILKSCPV